MPYNRKRRKILADVTVFNILVIGCLRQLDWRPFKKKYMEKKLNISKRKKALKWNEEEIPTYY
jgi:hypothetical protein